jgi:hypothetical protein
VTIFSSVDTAVRPGLAMRRPRPFLKVLQYAGASLAVLFGGLVVKDRLEVRHFVNEGTLFEVGLDTLRGRPSGETFAVMGDTGSGGPTFEALVSQLIRVRPDFVVVLGDINYRTPEHYEVFRESLPGELVVFAVPSNHDRKLDDRLGAFEKLIGPTYAAFTHGGATFLLLDTSLPAIDEEQRAWAVEALRSAGAGPKFILTHVPPYDPTGPTDPPRSRHSIWDRDSADWLVETAAREGVTAIFTGHWHGYYSARFSGVPCIVSGGGGHELDPGQAAHFLLAPLDGDLSKVRKVEIEPPSSLRAAIGDTLFEARGFSHVFAPFVALGATLEWVLVSLLLRSRSDRAVDV